MKWYEKQKKIMGLVDTMEQENSEVEIECEGEDLLESIVRKNTIDNEEKKEVYIPLEHQEFIVESTLPETVNVSTISKGAIINGDLEVDGDLNFEGILNGNVVCNGHVEISGQVNGNIQAKSAIFSQAIITGNTSCSEDVKLSVNTQIIGDVLAKNLYTNATIKGNVKVENEIALQSEAFIEGNVEAQYLGSERGSVLKGQYKIAIKE